MNDDRIYFIVICAEPTPEGLDEPEERAIHGVVSGENARKRAEIEAQAISTFLSTELHICVWECRLGHDIHLPERMVSTFRGEM